MTDAQGWGRRFTEWSRPHRLDAAILALVALVGLAVRLLTLEAPELGGDALSKWHFLRQLAHGFDFSTASLNHNHARWGVNWFPYLVQRTLGTNPLNYYVAPVTLSVGAACLSYLIGKRFGGRAVGVVAAIMFIESDAMVRAGSQLIPGVFSTFYVLAMVLCQLRYSEAKGRARWTWLVAGAVIAFLAYLTKIDNLYFVPGIVLAMWLTHRRKRDVAVYCLLLFAMFCGETLFYQLATTAEHRIGIIMAKHATFRVSKREIDSLWQLFDRYGDTLGTSAALIFYFFLAAAIWALTWARTGALWAVLLPASSFLLLTTFLLRGWDPLTMWSAFHERYLTPSFSLLIIVNAAFVAHVIRTLWDQAVKGERIRRLVSKPGLGAVAILLVAGAVSTGRAYWEIRSELDNHPLRVIPRHRALFNDTFDRNLPLVASRRQSRKPLQLVCALYLAEDKLLRNGVLPRCLGRPGKLGRGHFWLAANPKAYRADATAKLKKKKGPCVVRLARGGPMRRFMALDDTRWRLPDHCQARGKSR
ncbi:MAG: glycosyltransferase family 39 protein [Deltaproteobacteria bacterium]|nr:glycosyltransferase family 39 protein [Deltaproteobacteria bacterium]